ncbi:hypothetical protein [Nocardioides convexus]|uniref:hypothetical protein n=1 Tax=Nocardioides convexus TaxID=2712224 RepID=UPI00241889DA|nr:hypothetical protein [Nocardioides convexus]
MASHDLATRARDLVRIHDAVLAGSAPPAASAGRRGPLLGARPRPRDRSRRPQRPRPAGSRGGGGTASYVAAGAGRRRDPRVCCSPPRTRPAYLVVITDADGVVLWRSGSPRVRRQADGLGFAEGALWTEGAVGTNAIGTALEEGAPVQPVLRRALRDRTGALVLHGLPHPRPDRRLAARRGRRQRSRADPAPGHRGAGDGVRPARRGAAVASPRGAPGAACAARPSRCCPVRTVHCSSSTTTAGWPRTRASRSATGWRHRGRTGRSPYRVWGCACPSGCAAAG